MMRAVCVKAPAVGTVNGRKFAVWACSLWWCGPVHSLYVISSTETTKVTYAKAAANNSLEYLTVGESAQKCFETSRKKQNEILVQFFDLCIISCHLLFLATVCCSYSVRSTYLPHSQLYSALSLTPELENVSQAWQRASVGIKTLPDP